MSLPQDRKIDYGSIAHQMTAAQVKHELLTDDLSYTALVQDMSLALHDYIFMHERKNELKKFFMAPGVFDGLANVLARELAKSPIRPHLCDATARRALIEQIVTKLEEGVNDRDPKRFAEMCEKVPCLKLILPKANLTGSFAELQSHETVKYKMYLQGYQKFCAHHWRPMDIRRV